MTSSYRDQKTLRAIGHKLKPIVTVAQKGLSENILAEIDRALRVHELIKVKLVSAEREDRAAMTTAICDKFNATCVQKIGHVVLLYRAAREPDPRLSNVLRNQPG